MNMSCMPCSRRLEQDICNLHLNHTGACFADMPAGSLELSKSAGQSDQLVQDLDRHCTLPIPAAPHLEKGPACSTRVS